MPSAGSGEMFGTWKVPNGEGIANPPPSLVRSGCPGVAWHDEQPPALKTVWPLARSGDRAGSASAAMVVGSVSAQ